MLFLNIKMFRALYTFGIQYMAEDPLSFKIQIKEIYVHIAKSVKRFLNSKNLRAKMKLNSYMYLSR
jgi:hypothetical protein